MNEMVIIIRPSFKKICGPDACRAAVYNHILYRLARKAKDEPEEKVKKGEVFWFASAEDICKDMDNAWCVNKIRKEIKVLFESGLLGQRHNPLKGWDRKFQYFISEEQGIKILEKCKETGVCLMHLGLNSEVLHLLFMVNAFDKYGGCICQKEEMDIPNMVDAITKYGRAIPKGSTKGSSEESNQEESTIASAIAPAAHTPFSQQEEQAEPIRIATSDPKAREKAGQDVDEHENHSQSSVAQGNVVGEALSGRADAVPAESQKTAPKPQRKPKVLKDVPTAEQIEQVIVCMEQTIRRLTEQEDYTFGRSGKAKAAVKELLTGPGGTVRRITREKLEWEITKLYHRPQDPRTGFLWSDNLSVQAICNNYDKETMDYRPGGIAQSFQPQRTKPVLPPRMPSRAELLLEEV